MSDSALLPGEFAPGTEADNFRYYEPRCGHGSSLSPAMHGVVAARLGDVEMALRYFRQTAAIDLADTHAAIDGGVHIAALGGIWMLAVSVSPGCRCATTALRSIHTCPQLGEASPSGSNGVTVA